MTYHNFGICAQQEIQGERKGLARLRASYTIYDYPNGPGRSLESEFAEIAVYDSLKFISPTYKPFMSDMYSIN